MTLIIAEIKLLYSTLSNKIPFPFLSIILYSITVSFIPPTVYAITGVPDKK